MAKVAPMPNAQGFMKTHRSLDGFLKRRFACTLKTMALVKAIRLEVQILTSACRTDAEVAALVKEALLAEHDVTGVIVVVKEQLDRIEFNKDAEAVA